nr:MAG TPA: hypothetical protein [Caudoviricetes sp.]
MGLIHHVSIPAEEASVVAGRLPLEAARGQLSRLILSILQCVDFRLAAGFIDILAKARLRDRLPFFGVGGLSNPVPSLKSRPILGRLAMPIDQVAIYNKRVPGRGCVPCVYALHASLFLPSEALILPDCRRPVLGAAA